MPRENRSRYAVLGVLSYGPMSGYDIRKTIENTVGHFWRESYGQIYPILKELVREEWATVQREEHEDRPDRKVYSITPQGESALREWLSEPITYTTQRNELLLKLFFGGKTDREVSRRHLREFRDAVQEQLTQYEAIGPDTTGEPDQVYWMATLSFGKHTARAMLAWADEILEQLSEE